MQQGAASEGGGVDLLDHEPAVLGAGQRIGDGDRGGGGGVRRVGQAPARGVEGFAYVHFNERGAAALGGIGQADPAIPGYRPGINFYLQVDDIDATIAAAEAAGGRCTMPPAGIDGYRFALIADPEGNPIGLIKAAQPTARVQ